MSIKTKNAEMENSLYDVALRNIYDELYELNVTKNTYRIIYHTDDKYITPPDEGCMSETILMVAETMIEPRDKQRFQHFLDVEKLRQSFRDGKSSLILEVRKLCYDHQYHWASLTVFPAKDSGEDEILLCLVMDIGEKKRIEAIEIENKVLHERQMDDERYRIIIEQTDTIVCEWVRDGNKRYYAPQFKEKFSGNFDENRDLKKILIEDGVVHPDDAYLFKEAFDIASIEDHCVENEVRLLNKEGHYIWCRIIFSIVLNEEREIERVLGIINDIDQSKRIYETLRYQAEFDELTGIYNINTFYKHAKKLLCEKNDKKYAIIRMDINRFKFINDLYGMEEGNSLLRYIAEVIASNMTDDEAYGRMNSDIFCLCIVYSGQNPLLSRIEKILEAVSHYSENYQVMPSFGICIVKSRDVPISILCDWAHLAQKTIKGSRIQKWAFYDNHLRQQQLEEQSIENEMEMALAKGQFKVYLQPKHNMESGEIIGAEALVRWVHPEKGVMAPYRFIPLFERNGFIIKLDEFVWETTCAIIKNWIDNGYETVPVSMNVSRVHIFNPRFNEKLLAMVNKYGLPHELLEVELTESSFIENSMDLYKRMEKLKNEGIFFSMDDFGSGYSSLNMLKNTPVNTIKLDREFLNETVSTIRGRQVIKHTIRMVNDLNINIIAEGVETVEQAEFLASCGCMAAQGFYFSRPMPVENFEQICFKK